MVEQKFIDKIEDLRHCTYSRISDLQKNLCPMVKQIYLKLCFEYWYEGYVHKLWEDDVQMFKVNEIPYCYDNELRNTTFIDSLDNLIFESKVWPFLLFIDGCVIRWSDIVVIHDYNYTYFKIYNIKPDVSTYANIVVFPLHVNQIRYGEDNNILTTADRKGFYFGMDGKRLEKTDFVDIYVRLELLDSNIYYREIRLPSLVDNILEFKYLPDGYIPTLDNILTFTTDGSFNHLGTSKKIEDLYHGAYGLFSVMNNTFDVKWAILMYNTKDPNKESSYLFSKSNDLNRDSIVNLITKTPKATSQQIWMDIIDPLIKIFDFDFDPNSTYENNISNATKYITRYDFSLWKDVFKNAMDIKSYTYTGTQFKAISDSKGYVRYSRKHSDFIEDVALVFVNHKLYEYMIDVTNINNTINIPTFGIVDADHIEVIIYTECNNNVLEIVVEDPNTPVYIHPEYNLEDCYIMTDECPEDASYDLPPRADGRTQYIVEFTYVVDASSKYKINFKNEEYYNKKLKVVPKRQYRYYRFKQTTGRFSFTLPIDFKYCHNPDQYLVFVNGKKIDRTEYTVTIPSPDRPFDKIVLYVSTILDAGDYIDVFYIPEPMVEKYKQESMPKSGLLLLEDTETSINYPTTYPLSKDTSMIFINGLKVNPLDIKDVSLNSLLIGVDKYERNPDGSIKKDGKGDPIIKRYYVDSVNNITIVEYITGNKEVAGYLKGLYEQIPSGDPYNPSRINFNKSASDAWKDLIKTLLNKYAEEGVPHAGLQKIFGPIYELENPAPDYKDNFADLKSVLYDVIIEYYLSREEATTGDKFVYDFERTSFEPNITPDTKDVIKIIPLVPDKDKLVDYNVENNVARPEDVQEGKKFAT